MAKTFREIDKISSLSLPGLLVSLGLAVAYYGLAWLGLHVASVHGNVSPVWPATGLAIGVLLVGGCRFWPGVALGAFAANVFTSVPWFVAAGMAVGNTLEAVCGVWWVLAIGRGLGRFSAFATPVALVGAALLAPVVSASTGVGLLWASGGIPSAIAVQLWQTWWIGDVLGALSVAPLILAAQETWQQRPAIKRRAFVQAAVLGVAVVVVCGLVFGGRGGNAYLFTIFPLLLISVTWFGSLGVRLVGLIVAAVGIASTFHAAGPFVDGSLNDNLVRIQFFLTSVAIAAIALPGFKKSGGYALPFAVLLVGWTLSGWMFSSLYDAGTKVDDTRFKSLISDATDKIEQRIADYEDALQAGVALIGASGKLDRTGWAGFAQDLKLHEKYPGALGIGVAFVVRAVELDAFLARVRADAMPDFVVKNVPNMPSPPAETDGRVYHIITYIEPVETNRAALGLDIASEFRRQSASEAACVSGKAWLSRRIQLVQDATGRPGLLLFVPFYRSNFPVDTIEQRETACLGWVYAPLLIETVLQNVLGNCMGEIRLRFFEGRSAIPANLLFDSAGSKDNPVAIDHSTQIILAGQEYTLGWSRSEGFATADNSAALLAATGSALASLLLAMIVVRLQSTRRKAEAMVVERTAELESAGQRINREVFERQRAEHSLRESHRLQKAILNSANYSIISTTPDGMIMTFNAAAERMLGYAADEVQGRVTPAIIHDPNEVVARAAMLTGELGFYVEPGFDVFVAKAKLFGIDEREWTYIRKDGSRFPVLLSVTALRNEEHVITGFLGVGQDLTARKESENRTRQALDELARQKFALDQHAIVAVTDVNGIITYANEKFCAISGYSREELVGRNHRLIKSGYHPPEFYQEMFKVISRGDVWTGEICNQAKDGSLYWEASTIVPFLGPDGQTTQFVAIRTDITERKRVEENAARSERLIRAVTDGLPGQVAYWDADLRCTFANRAYCEWFGRRLEDVVGLHIAELLGKSIVQQSQAHIKGALDGKAQAFERTMTKANGETGHTWVQYVPDFGDDGVTVKGVFVLISDVTEVKKKGEALRESAQRVRLAADAAGIAIWEWDLQTNRLVWDTRMFEMYGIAPTPGGVAEYSTWSDCVLKEDLAAQENSLNETVRLAGHGVREFRIQRASDGVLRHIYACEDVICNEEGQAVRVVGVSMDITARKEAERAINESEERTRLFAEHAPASVAMFDRDMCYLVVSRQWLSDYKLEDHDIIGRSHYDVFPDLPEKWREIHQRCLAGAVETSESDRLDRIDGSVQWLRWEVRPWYKSEGVIGGIVMFTQDITLRKELEVSLATARDEALEASRLKSEFLATMSHEIRTPMNGVIGMSSLLLQSPLEIKQREMAQIIVRSAESLLAIINDILDFSKIEAGKFRIDPIDFNLRDAIEETVALLAPQAHRKGVELVCDIESVLAATVLGDCGRIQQVLTNLLGNAIKFTEKGEVRVTARAYSSEGAHLKFRIEIHDTGIGIPDAARLHLFRPFTQADGSTTRRFGGTGLGLAISSQLISLMNGQLGYESAEGKGSCFWFELLLQQVDPPQTEPIERVPAEARVLVVSHHETGRAILLRQITALDVRGAAASGLDEALTLMRAAVDQSDGYTVVLLDWSMPEQGADLLAKAIRADPRIASACLIGLTSDPQAITPSVIAELNINAVLSKPVRGAQLHRSLLRAFGRRDTPVPFHRKNMLGGRGLRLLVAEDNPTNQIVAQMMIEQLGHTIDIAGNGQEALDLLARSKYDAILMDCQMPVLDGYETTRRIRAGQVPGGNSRIPIIALTAYAMPGDRDKALAAGMDDYVAKPLETATLMAAVARCGLMPKPVKTLAAVVAPSHATPVTAPEKRSTFDPVRRTQLQKVKSAAGISLWDKALGVFMKEMPARMTSLETLAAERDGEKLAILAHTIVGSALNLGATELHRSARLLENAAREKKWDAVPESLSATQYAWQQLQVELDAHAGRG